MQESLIPATPGCGDAAIGQLWTRPDRRASELQWLCWAATDFDDAVFITDASGIVRFVNRSFESMTGFQGSEIIGRTPVMLNSGHHSPEFFAWLWSEIRNGNVFAEILVNRKKSGETYYEKKTIRPLIDQTGRISHFISTGRDVSRRFMREAA